MLESVIRRREKAIQRLEKASSCLFSCRILAAQPPYIPVLPFKVSIHIVSLMIDSVHFYMQAERFPGDTVT